MRQRTIETIDPVVSTIAMVALLAIGMDIWGLAIGAVVGSVAGAVAALYANPYPLRFRWDRGALREYFKFSWPLLVGGIGSLLVVQATLIIGNAALGPRRGRRDRARDELRALLELDRAVADDDDLSGCLRGPGAQGRAPGGVRQVEPAGADVGASGWVSGCPLFAADLVDFILGPSWDEAIPLIQIFGLIFGFGTIAFAWSVFYRARNDTRPVAVMGVVTVIASSSSRFR